MPVLRGSDGRDRWMEVKFNRLPKGGQKYTFGVKTILWIMCGTTFMFYGMLQADHNPASFWGRIYSKIANYNYTPAIEESRDDYAEEKKRRNIDD